MQQLYHSYDKKQAQNNVLNNIDHRKPAIRLNTVMQILTTYKKTTSHLFRDFVFPLENCVMFTDFFLIDLTDSVSFII